jgi:hypothetical protein
MEVKDLWRNGNRSILEWNPYVLAKNLHHAPSTLEG